MLSLVQLYPTFQLKRHPIRIAIRDVKTVCFTQRNSLKRKILSNAISGVLLYINNSGDDGQKNLVLTYIFKRVHFSEKKSLEGDLSMFLGRLFQGEKVEYDSPKNLLSDKKSVFYSMCKDAALVS